VQAFPHTARAFGYIGLGAATLMDLEILVRAVSAASFDVAGPVINRQAKVTNLPWLMDEDSLASDLGLNAVYLMNDLETVARALPVLCASDLITINEGNAVANGPIAIIAPGTGLGEFFLTWNGSQYVAHGSEGVTPISLRRTNGSSGCSDSCWHVGAVMSAWNESALESAFRTSMSFCVMKKKSRR